MIIKTWTESDSEQGGRTNQFDQEAQLSHHYVQFSSLEMVLWKSGRERE